jgi:hypothetical protein
MNAGSISLNGILSWKGSRRMCWTQFEKGRRRQDPIDPHKYKYLYPVKDLPFGLTHIVVVVRIAARKFVLTAYGIERKGGR